MQHRGLLALVAGYAFVGACMGLDEDPLPALPSRPNALFGAPVVRAPMHLPPYFGGTVLALSGGARAVLSDPDRDQLEVVDLDARTQRVVALTAGDEPGRAVEDASRRVHVVLRRGGAVATIDPVAGVLVRRTAVCPAPRGIAWDATAGALHVACEGGELVTLTSAGEVVRARRVASDLRDVVVLPQGVLVSRFRSAEAVLVRPDGTLTPIARPAPTVGDRAPRATMVAWSMVSDGARAWMVHQDATLAALAVPQANEPAPRGGSYGGGVLSSRSGDGAPSKSVLSELVGLDTPQPRWVEQTEAPTRGPAIDVAVEPVSGAMAAVSPGAGIGSNEGLRVSVFRGAWRSEGSSSRGGYAVASTFDREGRLLVESRSPHRLMRCTSENCETFGVPAREGPLSPANAGDDLRDTGRELFHMVTESGLTCVTCHPDGGDDGRTWDFQRIGLRRTPSLRGGILATAPFHWDGDLTNVGTLMREVFTRRMGGGAVSDAQVEALGVWVDGIPAVPVSQAGDAAQRARGEAIFRSATAACATCHAGEHMTNNQTLDVGTRGAFQVPSLEGLAGRAPYMHDGCATSLRVRFTNATCGGGDRHGRTSHLSTAQLDDLVAWLESR
jgi:hypothetical protein